MKYISKFILYNIMGWKIVGEFPKGLNKFILIGAPHTSNYDFIIGILMKFTVRLDGNFIGKKSLFNPPFGFIFRALGGVPVDRSKSKNMVQFIIDLFNEKEKFKLAMSPEGTRKKVVRWKTGFYHIAKGAGVPIILSTFDFGKKQIFIANPYYVTGDMEKDFLYFHNFYKDIKGKYPEQFEIDFHKNIR